MTRFSRQASIKASIERQFGRHPRGHCRACGEPVKPPRQSWCGKACVDHWLSLSRPEIAKRILAARDPHCEICRVAVWVELEAGDLGWVECESSMHSFNAPRMPIGFFRSGRLDPFYGPRWDGHWTREIERTTELDCELDHRIPLREGGEHSWDNLRLLCRACHAGETAALAGRLAAARKIDCVTPGTTTLRKRNRK